jgi:thiol:disulfide interchange protein DsbA
MKKLLSIFLATCAFAPVLALAQGKFAYTEVKPALAVEADGKIEVLEFFWYGCIHCYNLEPAVERWAIDAAIFYAFEALGVLDKMHKPFFEAIHRGRLKSDNKEALAEWLQKNGLEPKKFDDTMRSFGVQTKVRRAAQLTAAYKIDGTPAMAVHGRYTVSTEQGRTQDGMFETVNFLADTVRKSK